MARPRKRKVQTVDTTRVYCAAQSDVHEMSARVDVYIDDIVCDGSGYIVEYHIIPVDTVNEQV